MEPTTQTGWESQLEELIEDHIRNLKNDFRRFLDEIAAPEPPDPEPPEDLAATLVRLKESVSRILASQSQRDMATRLLDAVSLQSVRSALLLVRDGELQAHDSRGFGDAADDVLAFTATPEPDGPLARALLVTQHLPGQALAGTVLAPWSAAGPPAHVCLAPVCVGPRTVAIIYADSGTGETAGPIHPEAIEILTSMAGLFLDRLRHMSCPAGPVDASRTMPATRQPVTAASTDHHDLPSVAPAVADDGPAAREPAPIDLPDIEGPGIEETTLPVWQADADPNPPLPGAGTDTGMAAAGPGEAEIALPVTPVAGPGDELPLASMPSPEDELPLASILPPEDELPLAPAVEPEPDLPFSTPVDLDDGLAPAPLSATPAASLPDAPMLDTPPVSPAPSPPVAGTAPVTEPAGSPEATAGPVTLDDPPPVAPPARAPATAGDQHPDAARFARLLVSEIVLYNEAAVTAGRKHRDLHRRLRVPIDRSREAFMDRFNRDLAGLFDEEVVHTLAGGDRGLMGPSFS
ncbi:MAG: hypothetical protein ACE5IK_06450 [Acidobacteriota bacterium]